MEILIPVEHNGFPNAGDFARLFVSTENRKLTVAMAGRVPGPVCRAAPWLSSGSAG